MIPAERYSDDSPDAETIPSSVRNVVPSPPLSLPRAAVYLGAIVLTGICLAWTGAFVVDYVDGGAAAYGVSVVVSSATLGALLASAWRWVRGRK